MKIKIDEHILIKLSDGCHLAAKIWLPENAREKPVPAILEYIPYGKRQGTALRDQLTHPYFAENGYACLRVDIRGSGESEGFLMDEYTAQELQDCCEVLKWIAQQSWCTGKVGMMGISWGGFNSLQVAALKPRELAAVISLCSTDDRYADDCHFMGGCLLTDNFQWSARMLTTMSRPPDPQLVGEDWRKRWLARLNAQPLLASTWLNHPDRDDYWKHGSICEHYSDVQCPVYLISGWADGYSNTIHRMLEKLSCPRKGLIGPWGHKYPHVATPGPQIGFLQEAVRWWDKWLKGIENGIMEEPFYRVWLQNSSAPKAYEDFHDGRWVAVSAIPSPEIQAKNLYLSREHKLTERHTNDNHQSQTSSPQSLGETGGTWLSNGTGPERPIDQQFDDCRSICYTSAPLDDNLAIWGAPIIELEVAIDSPQASIAVRLNEILPTGVSCRISFGLLNLSPRKNDEKSTPTSVELNYLVQIKLNDAAHIFAKGSQIRIAISTAYWPIMWPSPTATTLKVSAQKSKLCLPIYLPNLQTRALPEFKPAVTSIPLEVIYSRPVLRERKIKRCLNDNSNSIKVLEDSGCCKMTDSNLEIDQVQKESYFIKDSDPLSARVEISSIISINRDNWRTRTESRSTMTSTETHYHLEAQVDAFENDKLINTKKWSEKLPRSHSIPSLSNNPIGLFKFSDKKTHDAPDQNLYAKIG